MGKHIHTNFAKMTTSETANANKRGIVDDRTQLYEGGHRTAESSSRRRNVTVILLWQTQNFSGTFLKESPREIFFRSRVVFIIKAISALNYKRSNRYIKYTSVVKETFAN